MARPELGTKRVCPTTGRKFYDLNKSPIISPYTGQVVAVALPMIRGVRPETASARPVDKAEDDVEADQAGDVELISLEDVDEEGGGAAKATSTDDDIEIEDDHSSDDDTFLEADEDENDDVIDLIGDGIEEEEER